MRVLVFGESFTQGFWDTQGGWVARLQRYYDERQVKDLSKELPRVMNLGISGATTNDLLARFDNETQARQNAKGVSFIFSTGGNSSSKEGNKYVSDPQTYTKQLETLIQKAKQYSHKIMFVGLFPCDDKRTNPVAWADLYFSNQRRLLFETTTAQVCKEQGVVFMPILEKFKSQIDKGKDMLAHDGMHPNDTGHQLVFELVQPELDKLLNT